MPRVINNPCAVGCKTVAPETRSATSNAEDSFHVRPQSHTNGWVPTLLTFFRRPALAACRSARSEDNVYAICICICMYVCTYIYIYIERERHIYSTYVICVICVIHLCIYIYIYMYVQNAV